MFEKIELPHWLCITGQSGSGKGTIVAILREIYEEKEVKYKFISNGDLFRAQSQKTSAFSKKMKEVNEMGLPQPLAISIATWWPEIEKNLSEEMYFIHEGSPRQPGEATLMAGIVRAGYLKSIGTIEVIANDSVCAHRLAERTKSDRRLDLSIPGKPGYPDKRKIARKLGWYTSDRNRIISEVRKTQEYIPLYNNKPVLQRDAIKSELESYFVF